MLNPYGMKDGQLVTVDSVERGLACDCTCPACGRRLEARKGEVKQHHFAHYNAPECGRGYQTAIHILAKELLSEEKRLVLPPLSVYPSVLDMHPLRKKVYREIIRENVTVAADEVSLERKIGRVIPDVQFRVRDRLLLVEIWVTHRVSAEKLRKIQSLDVAAIEFNFSKMHRVVTREDLSRVLLVGQDRLPGKGKAAWLFHPHEQWHQEKIDRDFAANSDAVITEARQRSRQREEEADRQNERPKRGIMLWLSSDKTAD